MPRAIIWSQASKSRSYITFVRHWRKLADDFSLVTETRDVQEDQTSKTRKLAIDGKCPRVRTERSEANTLYFTMNHLRADHEGKFLLAGLIDAF